MVGHGGITVVSDRYHGTYSGGRFTAWFERLERIPTAISGDDAVCGLFWKHVRENRILVGIGNTRKEAIRDLNEKRDAGFQPGTDYLANWLP